MACEQGIGEALHYLEEMSPLSFLSDKDRVFTRFYGNLYVICSVD